MIKINAHGFTDCGRQREYNEDGFGSWTNDGLFAVCDGMGGGRTGDIAMEIALAAIHEGFCAEPSLQGYRSGGPRGLERLKAAVQLANRRILEKSRSSRQYLGIGAAMAALSVEGDLVFIAHVGDCRVYRYRAGNLEALTRDHSLVIDFLHVKPDATAEEIAAIPRDVITRAIGLQDEIEVALQYERAFPGDLYLLCTDGVHDMIDDDAIAGILGSHIGLDALGNSLLDAALEAGGADNIAVVLVRCLAE